MIRATVLKYVPIKSNPIQLSSATFTVQRFGQHQHQQQQQEPVKTASNRINGATTGRGGSNRKDPNKNDQQQPVNPRKRAATAESKQQSAATAASSTLSGTRLTNGLYLCGTNGSINEPNSTDSFRFCVNFGSKCVGVASGHGAGASGANDVSDYVCDLCKC